MRIVIDIPDNEVPKTQEVVATYIHFIDGEVCELGNYGVMTLPKGHGDLIDREEVNNALEREVHTETQLGEADEEYLEGVRNSYAIVRDIPTVIPADKGEE